MPVALPSDYAVERTGVMPGDGLTTSLEWEHVKEWSRLELALAEITRYRDDWDGQGAIRPSEETLDTAWDFLFLIRGQHSPATSIAAGPLGTITFTWQNQQVYAEAELSQGREARFMLEIAGGTPRFETVIIPRAEA